MEQPGQPAGRWPAINTRRKHKVVDDELASSLEQVEEADLAVWSIEDVILLDPDHRQPAAFGGQRVARTRGGLLFHEQLIACSLPLFPRYNLRLAHAVLVSIGRRGVHLVLLCFWWNGFACKTCRRRGRSIRPLSPRQQPPARSLRDKSDRYWG